jgi:hypothetical protein
VRPTIVVLTLVLALAEAGCGNRPTGPGPGSNPPGAGCAAANDCYCWQCACEGVSGLPGEAQLCVSGKCPTGDEACATSCALAGAKVASASSVDTCNGVP